MDKPVLFIITVFFFAGGIDYMFGSRFSLGEKFCEGIKTMGPLALGIIGIYTISPLLLKLIVPGVTAVYNIFHIDPSVLPSCIFPVDMGGYTISKSLLKNAAVGRFSGIIIASSLGTTIGFSIPIACGFAGNDDKRPLAKGIIIGTIATVPGCFFAGLMCGVGFSALLLNMVPLFIIIALLGAGLMLAPEGTFRGFAIFGWAIKALGVAGLMLQALYVLLGIRLFKDIVPFGDAAFIVARIALILAGAYPMMEIINRVLRRHFEKIGSALGVNSESVGVMVGNLATNLLVFGMMKKMNEKGKVMCTALAVSAAFVFGGQFAYVASVEPVMAAPFFLSKFASGAISIVLCAMPAFLPKITKKLKYAN